MLSLTNLILTTDGTTGYVTRDTKSNHMYSNTQAQNISRDNKINTNQNYRNINVVVLLYQGFYWNFNICGKVDLQVHF